MTEEAPTRFSSALPVIIYSRPAGQDVDWQEVDRGPGYFNIPAGEEIRVKLKGIDDAELADAVKELRGVAALRFIDLAENRNVTNDGLELLKTLPQLTGLNLSSCAVTSTGLKQLAALPHLTYLNLSYCNRLTDAALKTIESMKNLVFVDLQGCLGLTHASLSRVRRRNLTIHR